MASFLTVPLKKTNEVDLAKPVRTFISSTYSTEETASVEIEEAINELNKLRNKAVIQPLDNHESSLDLITRFFISSVFTIYFYWRSFTNMNDILLFVYSQCSTCNFNVTRLYRMCILPGFCRYYDQLVAIENKLPLTPTQIPIAFKWKDAFDKGSLFFGRQSLSLFRSCGR